jgi:PAS domain S-box-containing protein
MPSDIVHEHGCRGHSAIFVKNSTVLLLLLLLLLLFSGTYGVYRSVSYWTKEAIQTQFDATAQNVFHLLEMNMTDVQGVMEGVKGLFDANKVVERDEWHTYFKAITLEERHPEIYGLGYIERVIAQDKAVFIKQVQNDTSTDPAGRPDFTIFPERQKVEYFVVKYAEPAAFDEKALGFDVSTDAIRFQTLQKAAATGEIAITPLIQFVTEANGLTLYLPLYQKGVPTDTPEQRKMAIAGFIVGALSVPQFFHETFHLFRFPRGFSMSVSQRGVEGEELFPLYDSIVVSEVAKEEFHPLYQKTVTLQFGGQTWEVESIATSAFKKSSQLLPTIILFGGSVISFLVCGIVIFIVISNAHMIQREKKYTEELRTTNQFLDSIIENIPAMIFVKDVKELRFVRFNRAGEELLGYRRSELIGKNDYDFFPKKQADAFVEKDRTVLRKKKLVDIPEEPIMTRYRGERILHTQKIPLLTDDGKLRYLLGISEDITESVREKKARAEFVTLVSHQLRTPLSTMRWSFEILRERLTHFSDAEQRLINQSYAAMLNMTQTINTMLTIAHIDTMKIVINRSNISLAGMLKSLVREFSIDAKYKHVQLTFKSFDDCRMKSDSNILREIFSNLLSNAIQYTPNGGRIGVSIKKEGQQAVVTVTDNGIGIPENAMESIFERLYRAKNAKKIRPSGSGLGLYVVRLLTILLGGTVSATSQEGKGTMFIIHLPLLSSLQSV